MNIEKVLKDKNIILDVNKDQVFLIDNKIIDDICCLVELNKNDIVLEIGAGIGNITKILSKKAGKVIAFEIDKQFKPFLEKMPSNVEVYYRNILDYSGFKGKYRKKGGFNKIISSLPYSLCEPILHKLTFYEYDKCILVLPKRFVYKIKINPIFSSFFKANILFEIEKQKFYPIPNTNSEVIELIKLNNPIKSKDIKLFLKQYLYKHENQKVKNSLREGIIEYYRMTENRKVTKNNARDIIEKSKISFYLLEKTPDNKEIYERIDDVERILLSNPV